MGHKYFVRSLMVTSGMMLSARGEEKSDSIPEELLASSLASMARDVLSGKYTEGRQQPCAEQCLPECSKPPHEECEAEDCLLLNMRRFLHHFQCGLLKKGRGILSGCIRDKSCIPVVESPCKYTPRCIGKKHRDDCIEDCQESSSDGGCCDSYCGGANGMILPFIGDSKEIEGMQVQDVNVKTTEGSSCSDFSSSYIPPIVTPQNCFPKSRPQDAVCQQGFFYPNSPGQVLTSNNTESMTACESICSNIGNGTEAYAYSFGGVSGTYANVCICYVYSPFGSPRIDNSNQSGTGPTRQCGHAVVDCPAAFYVGKSGSRYSCRGACEYYMKLHNQSNAIVSFVSNDDDSLTQNCYCYWRIPKNAKVVDCQNCSTRPLVRCSSIIPTPCNPCPCPCPPCGGIVTT